MKIWYLKLLHYVKPALTLEFLKHLKSFPFPFAMEETYMSQININYRGEIV